MTTLHDLEQTIVFLASNYASAICQLDGTEARAKETSDRLIAAREEVESLLAENATLRSDLDEHVSLIHRLCDERAMARLDYGTLDKMTKLYQAQSLEFCRNCEREEKRANAAIADLKRLKKAKAKR